MKKKRKKSMDELTANYDKFIKGKQVNADGKKLFNATLKKAAKPRGSK